MRRTRYIRNNSQSDLGDYSSPTSSSVRFLNQIANPSHEHITCMQTYNQSRVHSVEKIQKFDRRVSVYHDLVETSSAQTQNLKFFEDRENQFINIHNYQKDSMDR